MSPRFKVGDRVRVRDDPPEGHHRTPGYVMGRVGRVAALRRAFPDPESIARGGNGQPEQFLYLVQFQETDLWKGYDGVPEDQLLLDLYEHWLEVV